MPACVCCQSTNFESLPYKDQFNANPLIKCNSCSHVQVSKTPTEKEIGVFYETYSVERAKFVGKAYYEIMLKRAAAQFSVIKNAIKNFSATFLDIGCGYGQFLDVVRSNGFEGSGLEFDQKAIDYATEKNLKVSKIQSESDIAGNLKGKNVVVLSHVLEHLIDPNKILQEIEASNEYCFIEVPAYDSKNSLQFIDQEGHINFFNEKSLKALLERHFDIVTLKSYGLPISEFYSTDKFTNFKLKILRRITRDFFLRKYSTVCNNGIWLRAVVKSRKVK